MTPLSSSCFCLSSTCCCFLWTIWKHRPEHWSRSGPGLVSDPGSGSPELCGASSAAPVCSSVRTSSEPWGGAWSPPPAPDQPGTGSPSHSDWRALWAGPGPPPSLWDRRTVHQSPGRGRGAGSVSVNTGRRTSDPEEPGPRGSRTQREQDLSCVGLFEGQRVRNVGGLRQATQTLELLMGPATTQPVRLEVWKLLQPDRLLQRVCSPAPLQF